MQTFHVAVVVIRRPNDMCLYLTNNLFSYQFIEVEISHLTISLLVVATISAQTKWATTFLPDLFIFY